MAAASLEVVVKQLKDSGIIAPGKLENFIPPNAHPKDAPELARELVRSENLTPFQAQQVLHGKVKSLFLGNYTILDKLGAGGMGQVFKARHRRMDRLVALKMLPSKTMKDAAAVARFEREVRAAAKLLHPNIVAAHDADEAHGVHFLVMEYVDGKDLSVMVKKDGPLPVEEAVNYIWQATRGLEFAHAEGVVHRDIKPANLLLDKKGTLKILDMGLARIEANLGDATPAELTGTGAIMGTVDYMAPEQGVSTKDADARADIYSLGCTLHFLLTGKPVYEAESVAARLLAHHHQPIPDLCKLRSEVPQHLQQVFAKMVAKKREDRYQTMGEVIAAFQSSGVSHDHSLPTFGQTLDRDAFTFLREAPAAPTTQTPPATDKATAAGAGNKNRKPVYAIAAAAVLGVLILAGVIFKLQTKDGTLVVEIDQPDAEVQILSEVGKVEISQPGGKGLLSISVDQGKHKLRVEKDGFVVFGENFEIHTGKTTSIKATLEPLKKEVVAAAASADLPKPLVAPFDAAAAHAGQEAWARHLGTQVETTNSVGMRMTLIPPGEFQMGSSPEQVAWGRKSGEDDEMAPTDKYFGRLEGEMPQHKATIRRPLVMGSTEVTVAQFRKFVEASKYITEAEKYGFGNSHEEVIEKAKEADKGKNWKNTGYPTTDDTAVTQITWNDAAAYCAWLSEQEQRRPWYRPDGKGGWLIAASADGYRLPTEAEWEYACRGGTTTQYSFGDDKAQLERYGWFSKNAGGRPQPVALKLPNPFGLFDIHGNAQEWCQDWYDGKWYEKSSPADPNGPSSGSNRVIRGGLWTSRASYCRSAHRNNFTPSLRINVNGFRCVRPLDSTTLADKGLGARGQGPARTWETPEFQKWVADTQKLPAEQQIEAVSKKLMELNPGFDGKLTGVGKCPPPKIESHVVTELGFPTHNVADLSPLRALAGLKLLYASAGTAGVNTLSDLSPLEGMKLTTLHVTRSRVSDLAPLAGMPVTELHCSQTPIFDLSPLKGMPLGRIVADRTQVNDLSPLETCRRLTSLNVKQTQVTAAGVAALQKALPGCKIEWDGEKSAFGAGEGAKATTPAPAAAGKK